MSEVEEIQFALNDVRLEMKEDCQTSVSRLVPIAPTPDQRA